MTVALDTNVLIAAFVAHGVCHELLEHLVRHHEPAVSPFILGELEAKLTTRFGATAGEAEAAAELLRSRLRVVEPEPLPQPVCRDPDDDAVLALAVAASAACLLTGDRDLLVLGRYAGVPILQPSAFWSFERGA
ncbi:MAG TPA: putative toxin-antitoxin system toxin component, PIN family [Rubricoccaceae bacterium]|nr:putative toxin-antitoxin system toxin component, PIN family [Rubricoccaceae bacterium]